MPYTVIKDTREKSLGWFFPETPNCKGTIVSTLRTGDYTLLGFEDKFVIERKSNTSEFAANIYQKRFEKELIRLEEYEHPFMVLEFTMEDIVKFPERSGVPKSRWKSLKVTNWQILKKLMEYQMNYKTKIVLAGIYGRETAASIFKRVVEVYGKNTD